MALTNVYVHVCMCIAYIIKCNSIRFRRRTCHDLHYFLATRRQNSSINLLFEEAISATGGFNLRDSRTDSVPRRWRPRLCGPVRSGEWVGNPSRARIPLSNPFNIKPPSPYRRRPSFFLFLLAGNSRATSQFRVTCRERSDLSRCREARLMGGPRIPRLPSPKNGRTRGWAFLPIRVGRTCHVPGSYDITRTDRNVRSRVLQRVSYSLILFN